jgi:hypothetical protein
MSGVECGMSGVECGMSVCVQSVECVSVESGVSVESV